jgi:putative hydrolase of the HAD superfamily
MPLMDADRKQTGLDPAFPALDAFHGAFFVIYWINERILEYRNGEAMIRAVVFDMFETLVTLFEGRTYFGENIAADIGVDPLEFRKEWNSTEKDRSTGKYTIEEALKTVFERLGIFSEEKTELAAKKRRQALSDTFSAIPGESLQLLKKLKANGIKIGLVTNTFSDERDFIRESPLFPYFDAALISFEQGICKPDRELFRRVTELLDVSPGECLYVGDGGSGELYAAREAGMHPLQCTWFHERAFEPHIPCRLLDEFEHADHPFDVLDHLSFGKAARGNIVLVGMPASGKSTVGIILAKILGMDFIDSDILLQQREGKKLREIIESEGVDGFLKCEEETLLSINVTDTVIATGGSAVYSEKAMHYLKRRSDICYLEVSKEELVKRLDDIKQRGVVLRKNEDLDGMFAARKALYEKYADVTVSEKGRTLEKTVQEVLRQTKNAARKRKLPAGKRQGGGV